MHLSLLLAINAIIIVESFTNCNSKIHLKQPPSSSHLITKNNDGVQSLLAVASSITTNTQEDTSSSVDDGNKDTLLQFSKDVKYALHDLRGDDFDPCIPRHLMGRTSSLSYSKTWTLDDWEVHNSRKRYLRYFWNFPHSRLLRRIMPQQTVLFAWSLLSIWIEDQLFKNVTRLSLSSLGSISTFLAFLLTLRSNTALARLTEARLLWSKVILNTREMAQMIYAFIYPVDKQLALMLARHVALFGWLLKSQLRFVKRDDVVELVRTMLPNKSDADYVLSQRQKTSAVITRIRQVLAHLGKKHQLTTAEEIALDHCAHALSEAVTSTGRIRASPIPTLYTSHTSRLLIFYLFCLPPALHMSGLDTIMTTLLSMVVGFAMFGLDEISHLFEQPFRVIPMYQMSKRSMQAVADAFTCQPPLLKGEVGDEEANRLGQRSLTSYWTKQDMASMSDNLME